MTEGSMTLTVSDRSRPINVGQILTVDGRRVIVTAVNGRELACRPWRPMDRSAQAWRRIRGRVASYYR